MNTTLDVLFFVGLILVLVGGFYLLHRSETKTKNKYKMTAYNLLEEKNPDPKEVENTLRMLHVYGGRFRKDPEFDQLQVLLIDLLRDIENTGVATGRKVKK